MIILYANEDNMSGMGRDWEESITSEELESRHGIAMLDWFTFIIIVQSCNVNNLNQCPAQQNA